MPSEGASLRISSPRVIFGEKISCGLEEGEFRGIIAPCIVMLAPLTRVMNQLCGGGGVMKPIPAAPPHS